MQGKLAIAVMLSAFGFEAVFAGELSRRVTCPRIEQAEQSQQRQTQARAQQQPQRSRSKGCPVQRQIPPVVDPTPHFFL